jgi:hypothetical protein
MNNVNKIVGKKITSPAGIISLLFLAVITSVSGVAMPGTAYASDDPHNQKCISIGGDGGFGGYVKNSGDLEAGKGGLGDGGRGGLIEDNVNDMDGKQKNNAKGGDGTGGAGGDSNVLGGDGGHGGKSRLACIIVDPDLTVNPTIVVPEEAFEPRPYS